MFFGKLLTNVCRVFLRCLIEWDELREVSKMPAVMQMLMLSAFTKNHTGKAGV